MLQKVVFLRLSMDSGDSAAMWLQVFKLTPCREQTPSTQEVTHTSGPVAAGIEKPTTGSTTTSKRVMKERNVALTIHDHSLMVQDIKQYVRFRGVSQCNETDSRVLQQKQNMLKGTCMQPTHVIMYCEHAIVLANNLKDSKNPTPPAKQK